MINRFFAFSFALLLGSSTAFGVTGQVSDSLKSPGEHSTGLAYDGKYIWVADRLTDSLYAIDPLTGSLRIMLPSPGYMPRGLCWDGEALWVVDQEEKRINRINVNTGITVKTIESPTTSVQGLAWDGQSLWISDDREDVICQISTDDGTVIHRFDAPSSNSTGLTWWNGYLWCADRRDDRIYLIDPTHFGEVVFGFPSPAPYPRGLTVVGDQLVSVDYQTDKVYRIIMDDGKWIRSYDSHIEDLTLAYEFRDYGPGDIPLLDIFIALPSGAPNQLLKTSPVFDPAPMEILHDRWNQPIAHFQAKALSATERTRITMKVTAELSAAQWFVYPHKVGSLTQIPQEIHDKYLADEEKYQITDEQIQDAARAAVGTETNPYWMMRNIHKAIREKLHYELSGGWNVAPRVWERGSGSCSEYTFLFIAMCRAVGIPARYVGSLVIRGDDASTDDVFHRWSQVYLPNYGWVHIDPQGGDKSKPADVAASIGNLSNRFLITTVGGGGSEYLGWGYNYDHRWTSRGPVKTFVEVFAEWSPVKTER